MEWSKQYDSSSTGEKRKVLPYREILLNTGSRPKEPASAQLQQNNKKRISN